MPDYAGPFDSLAARMRLPLMAAPMLRVSGPELVIAACNAGVVGAFPTANTRDTSDLDRWLTEMAMRCAPGSAPYAPNLVMRASRTVDDLQVLIRHRVEMVIASVGSPASLVGPLHDIGAVIFADVATLHHAERAVAAGVDGLVLLSAGAGGQTGWMNPFAFVRAVRGFFDGPIALAGGISDGASLAAARVLGADFGYAGTAFVATTESMAPPAYKSMCVTSTMDDVVLTRAFTGLRSSILEPSIVAVGLDPTSLDEKVTPADADTFFGNGGKGPRRWAEIWSAGHSVSGVHEIPTTSDLVERLIGEYARASASFEAATSFRTPEGEYA